ncbi:response regulator [Chryseobacterium sp. GMJ5]|uniref:Response regulator n=1 Tax=Chryseobacterium gilvum TaxID=2976534 RepID=A0ABT2VVS1_9FLAO|nr:response regulator [Chryseobacterium gilvum]MCU7614092.1 response regulator [Chryseobacterium gilvum]
MSKKILIVDDDPRNIFALKLTLKARGYSMETSAMAKDAIHLLENDPEINVVLMDMMMPEMDGYEAIKIIRQNPSISHIPIIAVTAQAMEEDRQKCLDAGAQDYVKKPIDVDVLIKAIEKLS